MFGGGHGVQKGVIIFILNYLLFSIYVCLLCVVLGKHSQLARFSGLRSAHQQLAMRYPILSPLLHLAWCWWFLELGGIFSGMAFMN